MLAVRCQPVVRNGGCLKKHRTRVWRWSRRHVRFQGVTSAAGGEVEEEDILLPDSSACLKNSIIVEACKRAEALFTGQRFPPSFPYQLRMRIPKFDTRCQGLLQSAELACPMYPDLPKLVVLARVWRELPMYRHDACFDLSGLRADILTGRKCRDPKKLKWLLLCLNRLLMSVPLFDCLAVLEALRIVHRVPPLAQRLRTPIFFAFTPAIWCAEDYACADDPEILKFSSQVSMLFDPEIEYFTSDGMVAYDVCENEPKQVDEQVLQLLDSAATTCTSEDEADKDDDDEDLAAAQDRAAPFKECSAELMVALSQEREMRIQPSLPSFLSEGEGYKVRDVRQFKNVLKLITRLWPESVAMNLLIDQILTTLI